MLSLATTFRVGVIRFGGLLQVSLIFTRYFDSAIFMLFNAILPAIVEECADANLAGGTKQVVEFAVALGGIISAILRTAQVKPLPSAFAKRG